MSELQDLVFLRTLDPSTHIIGGLNLDEALGEMSPAKIISILAAAGVAAAVLYNVNRRKKYARTEDVAEEDAKTDVEEDMVEYVEEDAKTDMVEYVVEEANTDVEEDAKTDVEEDAKTDVEEDAKTEFFKKLTAIADDEKATQA
jgi:hypothetical protein